MTKLFELLMFTLFLCETFDTVTEVNVKVIIVFCLSTRANQTLHFIFYPKHTVKCSNPQYIHVGDSFKLR